MLQVDKIILKASSGVSRFYIKLNRPLKAVRFLEMALKASPENRELHLMLATAQRAAGLRDVAIDTLKNAKNVFPEDSNILWGLGVWLLEFRRPADALKYLVPYLDNWAEKDNKRSLAHVYSVIGLCHLSLKRWDEAEEFLHKSRDLAFWDLDACIGIVALYNYTGRLEKIPAILDEYIRNSPDLYPPYFWMGHQDQYS